MKIDSKDLIPLPINEFKLDGTFYLLVSEGDFARCQITVEDMKDEWRAAKLRYRTMEYHKQGRLFLVRQRPWEPITI